MIPEENPFRDAGSLPDDNTAESILYGSSYRWIKNALWAWDELESAIDLRIMELYSQILDRQFAYEVMSRNPYVIFSKSPKYNDPRKLRDVFTLRELVKCNSAVHKIQAYREKNK